MSEKNNQVNQVKKVDEHQKREQNKKMLMWAILIVIVLIVLYVVLGDKKKKLYRINTETRNLLPAVRSMNSSSVADSYSYTPMNTTVSSSSPLSASSSLSVNNTSASEVRKQLINLFKAYE